jgi:glycosyltransferase involved in cell wall biosynthesis
MINNTKFYSKKRTVNSKALFSILIPTWNNLEYLKLCVSSIKKNSFFSHEIIIHVNEGSDGTVDWLNEQEDLSYTFSSRNVGVCFALNYSSTFATTEYILYMNDDMYACPNWDKYLHDEIKSIGHHNFFLSATAIEPKAQSKCSIEKNYGLTIDHFNEDLLLEEYSSLPMEDWQGATWPPNIVHKSIWELAGKYSIDFSPGMYSDPDFSMKLWQMGIRLFKGIGKSRVYHFGSISVKRVKKNKGYYQFISKWGMTQGTFSKYYLKRGQVFDGILEDAEIPFLVKLKSGLKQLLAVFSSN